MYRSTLRDNIRVIDTATSPRRRQEGLPACNTDTDSKRLVRADRRHVLIPSSRNLLEESASAGSGDVLLRHSAEGPYRITVLQGNGLVLLL
jgi:hypothetical protein